MKVVLKLIHKYLIYRYRCRSSRGENLDCVGMNPHEMESHGNGKSSRNGREYWGKLPEPPNGHGQGQGQQVIR